MQYVEINRVARIWNLSVNHRLKVARPTGSNGVGAPHLKTKKFFETMWFLKAIKIWTDHG
jgi:hypothetical protein